MASRPPSLTCALCGRQYGTASISIHIKSCKAAWLREEGLKPASQRRPLPDLMFSEQLQSATERDAPIAPNAIDAWNEQASDVYNKHSLEKCAHCDRSFTASALAHHAKSCTADSPARRVGSPLPGGGAGAIRPASPATAQSSRSGSASSQPHSLSPARPQTSTGSRSARSPASAAVPASLTARMGRSPANGDRGEAAVIEQMDSSVMRDTDSANNDDKKELLALREELQGLRAHLSARIELISARLAVLERRMS